MSDPTPVHVGCGGPVALRYCHACEKAVPTAEVVDPARATPREEHRYETAVQRLWQQLPRDPLSDATAPQTWLERLEHLVDRRFLVLRPDAREAPRSSHEPLIIFGPETIRNQEVRVVAVDDCVFFETASTDSMGKRQWLPQWGDSTIQEEAHGGNVVQLSCNLIYRMYWARHEVTWHPPPSISIDDPSPRVVFSSDLFGARVVAVGTERRGEPPHFFLRLRVEFREKNALGQPYWISCDERPIEVMSNRPADGFDVLHRMWMLALQDADR